MLKALELLLCELSFPIVPFASLGCIQIFDLEGSTRSRFSRDKSEQSK